jgi:hypothetical protein
MRSKCTKAAMLLIAALAVSGVGVSAASAALPEFGTSSFPVAYAFTSSQATKFEVTAVGSYITCTGVSAEGRITGAKALTANFDLTNCTYEFGSGGENGCTSKGANLREIRSESLKGSLVYIAKASKEVGIVFNPYEKAKEIGKELPPPPPTFATFVCGEGRSIKYTMTLRNGVIVPVTSLNTLTKSYKLKFAVSGGLQVPATYENASGEKVRNLLETDLTDEGRTFYEGGMETAGTLTTANNIEVKG